MKYESLAFEHERILDAINAWMLQAYKETCAVASPEQNISLAIIYLLIDLPDSGDLIRVKSDKSNIYPIDYGIVKSYFSRFGCIYKCFK